jgi:hypothetical protein
VSGHTTVKGPFARAVYTEFEQVDCTCHLLPKVYVVPVLGTHPVVAAEHNASPGQGGTNAVQLAVVDPPSLLPDPPDSLSPAQTVQTDLGDMSTSPQRHRAPR